MNKSDLSKYMATIGSKGGQATGSRKARSPEHYAKLAAEKKRVARLVRKGEK